MYRYWNGSHFEILNKLGSSFNIVGKTIRLNFLLNCVDGRRFSFQVKAATEIALNGMDGSACVDISLSPPPNKIIF